MYREIVFVFVFFFFFCKVCFQTAPNTRVAKIRNIQYINSFAVWCVAFCQEFYLLLVLISLPNPNLSIFVYSSNFQCISTLYQCIIYFIRQASASIYNAYASPTALLPIKHTLPILSLFSSGVTKEPG